MSQCWHGCLTTGGKIPKGVSRSASKSGVKQLGMNRFGFFPPCHNIQFYNILQCKNATINVNLLKVHAIGCWRVRSGLNTVSFHLSFSSFVFCNISSSVVVKTLELNVNPLAFRAES